MLRKNLQKMTLQFAKDDDEDWKKENEKNQLHNNNNNQWARRGVQHSAEFQSAAVTLNPTPFLARPRVLVQYKLDVLWRRDQS